MEPLPFQVRQKLWCIQIENSTQLKVTGDQTGALHNPFQAGNSTQLKVTGDQTMRFQGRDLLNPDIQYLHFQSFLWSG